MHTHTHARMHAHARTHTHAHGRRARTHTHACACTHTAAHLEADKPHTRTHTHADTHSCAQRHTWKRTAEDLLQCMEMGAKPYRALSTSRLKEFQGTEANCSGTDAWGQVQTSSLLNLVREGAAQKGVWGSGGEPSKAPVMRLCRGVGSPEQPF